MKVQKAVESLAELQLELENQASEAEFIDLWLGDKVNSGTPGYMAGGPVRQPYAGVDFIPLSGIF